MKKVLILTFSKVANRGANMQCYALKIILESLGCSVCFIDYQLLKKKGNFKGYVDSLLNGFFAFFFRRKMGFCYTRKYKTSKSLRLHPPVADVYVVGSDQVWNPQLTAVSDSTVYFFSFLPEQAKKIAYAASFGQDTWTETSYDNEIRSALQSFAAIGVRERSGVRICEEVFGKSGAAHVLDPTLLLRKSDVLKMIHTRPLKERIFCYLLYETPEILQICSLISNRLDLPLYPDNSSSLPIINKMKHFYGPVHWLEQIASARYVLTNSFHCMVFSLLLEKDFWIFPAYGGRESRMLDLLELLGLRSRYISSVKDLSLIDLDAHIDYGLVNAALSSLREKSLMFLERNIVG